MLNVSVIMWLKISIYNYEVVIVFTKELNHKITYLANVGVHSHNPLLILSFRSIDVPY